MIRRTNPRTFRVFSLLLILYSTLQACHGPVSGDHSRSAADKTVTLSVRACKSDSSDTWGYEILIDKKVYIHQEFIPALEGNQLFKNKKDALKVGRAVMYKIKNKKLPALSKEEVLKLLDINN
jgi:hypothetical protein